MLSKPENFGIGPDGFDPALVRHHDMVVVTTTSKGRGGITHEQQPMPLEMAREMRASLAAALARLDAEINGAEET